LKCIKKYFLENGEYGQEKGNPNPLRRTKIIFTNKWECEPDGQTDAHIDYMLSAKGGEISG
jgi:hypothetical protein